MTDKEDKRIQIPNLHPSQRPTTSYGSSQRPHDDYNSALSTSVDDQELSSSFKDRFESFVGSYSRASLMHMAENVVVSEGLVSFFSRKYINMWRKKKLLMFLILLHRLMMKTIIHLFILLLIYLGTYHKKQGRRGAAS